MKPVFRRSLLALVAAGGVAIAFPAYRAVTRPPVRYTIRPVAADFDTTRYTGSRAWDINNLGDVVGTVAGWDGSYPFIDRDGVLSRPPLDEAPYSLARINDRGDLLLEEAGGETHLVVWRNEERTAPMAFGKRLMRGALGEDGSVAGAMRETVPARIAIWRDDRGSSLSVPGAASADIIAVNDMVSAAMVVGQSDGGPVLWRSGAPEALTILPGYTHGQALAINQDEQVVGFCDRVSGSGADTRACLWEGGGVRDLGALWNSSQANDINVHGVIIGASVVRGRVRFLPAFWRASRPFLQFDPSFRAVVFENDRVIDLNTLIPRRSGWTLHDASAINDRGQIVGRGRYQGKLCGFVLTPVHISEGSEE